MTDATPTSPRPTPSWRDEGITLPKMRRFMTTLGFWAIGLLAALSGIFCLAMTIIVPAFSLQNDIWNRPDNPYTFVNGLIYLAIGGTAIYAARGSDRSRIVFVAIAVVASIIDGLYDLGVFHA